MTEALKPSEVLSRAADLIEPEGRWTQRAFARPRPDPTRSWRGDDWPTTRRCWCVRGAIAEVMGLVPGEIVEAEDYLRSSLRLGLASLISFNDDPDRTQAEVVSALRKASELAKAEGQ